MVLILHFLKAYLEILDWKKIKNNYYHHIYEQTISQNQFQKTIAYFTLQVYKSIIIDMGFAELQEYFTGIFCKGISQLNKYYYHM